MCQYSSEDGFANDWHLVHLGSRAAGGAGLVIMEASAVEARGRISPQDQGIWKDDHIAFLARIAAFVRQQSAVAAIQLAHAGRKASTRRPWDGPGLVPLDAGGWQPVAPSAVPFQPGDPAPAELSRAEIAGLAEAFAAAAAARACRRLSGGGAPLRARLPGARIPVAAQQPPRRRIRRLVRQPHPLRLENAPGGARRLARQPAAIGAHLGQRLGGRRLGHRRIGGTGEAPATRWAWI